MIATSTRARTANHYLLLAGFLVVQLFPMYWMLITSFKTPNQSIAVPPIYFPTMLTMRAYRTLFVDNDFGSYLMNSLVVCLGSMAITMVMSAIAGYGFARWTFPGKGPLLAALMLTSMLPFISVIGPTFNIIRHLDLIDTKRGLGMVFVNGGIPLATWFLYVFFQTIPKELEEAAALDGAGRIRTFLRVVLPLSAPGLASTAALVFISYWNELIFALVITLTPESKTLTVGLSELPGLFDIPYDLMAAAGMLTALPAIIIVVLFQRHLVAGLTAGAVK
jgi:ABC-type glycerol-3-phosphate transport system permease component